MISSLFVIGVVLVVYLLFRPINQRGKRKNKEEVENSYAKACNDYDSRWEKLEKKHEKEINPEGRIDTRSCKTINPLRFPKMDIELEAKEWHLLWQNRKDLEKALNIPISQKHISGVPQNSLFYTGWYTEWWKEYYPKDGNPYGNMEEYTRNIKL